ncbi:MAG: hypothetical protein U5K71_13305 [Gracilimonas sp.]|nr:hypothetical protein [Gracilimonas sp.]
MAEYPFSYWRDLPFSKDEIPDVFTQFRKKLEKESEVRQEIPSPQNIDLLKEDLNFMVPETDKLTNLDSNLDKGAVLEFKGGEDAALQRLKKYIWDGDNLELQIHAQWVIGSRLFYKILSMAGKRKPFTPQNISGSNKIRATA